MRHLIAIIIMNLGGSLLPAKEFTTHTFARVGEHELKLDLYRSSGDIKGVIVWVHGGAWRAGSRANPSLKGMTAHGWVIASVDYRLSGVAPFPAVIRTHRCPSNQAHELHGVYKSKNLPVHFEVKHGSAHGGPAFSDPAELARIDAFLAKHLSR